MITYVDNKNPPYKAVEDLLSSSIKKNRWTNFGPVAAKLEEKIAADMEIGPNFSVVVCASGTAALHSIIKLYNIVHQMELIVPSFAFSGTAQGDLENVKIKDCDKSGILMDSESGYRTIIVNPFGTAAIDGVGELTIVDSALAYGPLCKGLPQIVSFHHTKPWGFGEGGCMIVHKEYDGLARDLISARHPKATNVKMSEVSAAFILAWIDQMRGDLHLEQYQRILQIASEFDIKALGIQHAVPQSVPLQFKHPVFDLTNKYVKLEKYYKPLRHTPNATKIFQHMVNFPCHPGIAKLSDDHIRDVIEHLTCD